jgi:DNA-binding NtrC family response regulator
LATALFGHVKGAFTGAATDTRGLIDEAAGGTLMFDGIDELPLELQPSLLRVIESGRYVRMGDAKERHANVRVLATAQSDLEGRVREGRFRADLYFRLSSLVVKVPPLRERREDIAPLANRFASELAGAQTHLPASILSRLSAQGWPGNVRELRNAVLRLSVLGEAGAESGGPSDFRTARESAIRAFEKSYLEALLRRHRGSGPAAAKEANLARSYFYRLLEEHGLDSVRVKRPPKG